MANKYSDSLVDKTPMCGTGGDVTSTGTGHRFNTVSIKIPEQWSPEVGLGQVPVGNIQGSTCAAAQGWRGLTISLEAKVHKMLRRLGETQA